MILLVHASPRASVWGPLTSGVRAGMIAGNKVAHYNFILIVMTNVARSNCEPTVRKVITVLEKCSFLYHMYEAARVHST